MGGAPVAAGDWAYDTLDRLYLQRRVVMRRYVDVLAGVNAGASDSHPERERFPVRRNP
jgi:hypothetical protein